MVGSSKPHACFFSIRIVSESKLTSCIDCHWLRRMCPASIAKNIDKCILSKSKSAQMDMGLPSSQQERWLSFRLALTAAVGQIYTWDELGPRTGPKALAASTCASASLLAPGRLP
eukprot:4026285-Pleurochrysis_carterae.AAC.6